MLYTVQYAWRNSKINGRSSSNILIRCKQSVPTCRLLFWTSLWIPTIKVSVLLQQIIRLASLSGYSCVENCELHFLILRPFGLDRHPVSRSLVTKLTPIQVKLQVVKWKWYEVHNLSLECNAVYTDLVSLLKMKCTYVFKKCAQYFCQFQLNLNY
jgi:hypothetical protein